MIRKRVDGSVGFHYTWNDYKCGIGNLVGEFWLRLDKINHLTRNMKKQKKKTKKKNKLRVDLEVKTGETVHHEYGWFGIGRQLITGYTLVIS